MIINGDIICVTSEEVLSGLHQIARELCTNDEGEYIPVSELKNTEPELYRYVCLLFTAQDIIKAYISSLDEKKENEA